jgi:arylsulfatase A-like enzyme
LRGPENSGAILISIDTLRPDHLGCYGYQRETSPTVDAFAHDAVLFTEAIAQAPSTLPSHASMLSSLLPNHHGAYFSRRSPLPADVLSVAEVLSQEGFRTAAFNGGGQIAPVFGLDQGFEIYDSQDEIKFREVVSKAIAWLETLEGQPFFLFLHTYEVHAPYQPEKEYLQLFNRDYRGSLPDTISVEFLEKVNSGEYSLTADDLGHVIDTYDAEIRSMDQGLQVLLSYLKETGLYDSTVIVFTSDHGEEFGEHGQVGWHSHTLYDELLKVPLIIKLPRRDLSAVKIRAQVRLLDVAPTLLEALNLEVPLVFQGSRLQPIIANPHPVALPAVSIKDTKAPHRFASLRLRKWKLIGNGIFNLTNDPGEHRDLSAQEPELTGQLQDVLSAILAQQPSLSSDPVDLGADSRLKQQLQALGYVD